MSSGWCSFCPKMHGSPCLNPSAAIFALSSTRLTPTKLSIPRHLTFPSPGTRRPIFSARFTG